MCNGKVQDGKRDSELHRLLGRELLRDAWCEQFGDVPELHGQLELGGGELFHYIMCV